MGQQVKFTTADGSRGDLSALTPVPNEGRYELWEHLPGSFISLKNADTGYILVLPYSNVAYVSLPPNLGRVEAQEAKTVEVAELHREVEVEIVEETDDDEQPKRLRTPANRRRLTS